MKLTSIEAARGVAAIMVVFYHVSNHMRHNIGYFPLGGIAQFGHAGVDFFFVLSGFIIYYVHNKDFNTPSRLINYTQRRFTRIYPLYWFVIILTFVLEVIFSKNHKPDLSVVLNSATLLPTLGDPYIGVAWTLQHEIIFYAIFSIAIINYRIGLIAFLTWITAFIANWLLGYSSHENAALNRILSPYSIQFFLGMFSAWITLRNQKTSEYFKDNSEDVKKMRRNAKLIIIIGLFSFLMFGFAENLNMYDKNSVFARCAYGISSTLIIIGLATAGEIKNKRVLKIATILGSASFSIYLTHYIFIGIIYKLLEISGLFTSFYVWFTYLLLLASGIAGGVIISHYIEHPLTELTRRYLFKINLLINNARNI